LRQTHSVDSILPFAINKNADVTQSLG